MRLASKPPLVLASVALALATLALALTALALAAPRGGKGKSPVAAGTAAPEPLVTLPEIAAAWEPARLTPQADDRGLVGFRLASLPSGGAFAKLGLRAGDLLVAVAGVGITSPARALEAYGRLRSARRASVDVVRDGEPLRLWFRLR